MFSRTTTASSIRIPIANESPINDIASSLKPRAHTAIKLASTEIGSATPVVTVERHEVRNRRTKGLPVAIGNDEVAALRRSLETTVQPDGALVERAVHAPDRRRQVLRLQRLYDLRDAHVCRLQPVGIDLHRELALDLPEDLHVGH